ncbi:response regulator [Dokdonella sp.]|uniref:response regulator n=1 Tax=Dokdonella sp. TaxID=2291710 RepID=UPI003F7EFA8D
MLRRPRGARLAARRQSTVMKPGYRPILVVEDDRFDAEMIQEALHEVGAPNPVERVEDGADAVDFLFRRNRYAGRSDEAPALVLLDIKMPLMDGFEVLRTIRESDYTRQIPVVILTSSSEERDITQSRDLGANAYVVKPTDAQMFSQAVRTVGEFWTRLNELPLHTAY